MSNFEKVLETVKAEQRKMTEIHHQELKLINLFHVDDGSYESKLRKYDSASKKAGSPKMEKRMSMEKIEKLRLQSTQKVYQID